MPEPQPAMRRVTAYYSEQETAQYSRLEVQFLHQLTEAGVISGIEVAGEAQRRYDDADLALLRRVRRLYQDLGVNLEGIEIIMRLAARIDMLQRSLERYAGSAGPIAEERMERASDLDRPGTEEQP